MHEDVNMCECGALENGTSLVPIEAEDVIHGKACRLADGGINESDLESFLYSSSLFVGVLTLIISSVTIAA